MLPDFTLILVVLVQVLRHGHGLLRPLTFVAGERQFPY